MITAATASPKVFLRALEPEDLELLYSIENDTELWDVCDDPMPYSRFALRQYLAAQPQDIYQSHEQRLAIVEIATGTAVGLIDLLNFSPLARRAEVAIALLREKRALGLGAEALEALENYARRHCRVRLLFATVSARHNPVSQSLFRSAGYARTALLPQWHYRDGEYEDVEILQKVIEKTP